MIVFIDGYCRMLSRRDIEVVVQSGLPFLFKNSDDSVRRMRLFLHGSGSNVSLCENCLCKKFMFLFFVLLLEFPFGRFLCLSFYSLHFHLNGC